MTTTPRHLHKAHLYQLFARITTALANPHRLELIDLLVQAPRTVEVLAQEARLSVANTSQHLQRLKQAHLITDEREGIYIRYRLADPAIAALWSTLRAVAEQQLTEIDHTLDLYREHRHTLETITIKDLQARLARQEVLLIDVRPTIEYDAAHIPGALSMPIDTLPTRLHTLPRSHSIVAYCRGPYCVYADDAVRLLTEAGHHAMRLEAGVLEWHQPLEPHLYDSAPSS